MQPTLNAEQSAALSAIDNFLNGEDSFFVLSGSAGTGKTFCVRELVNRTKGRFIFTAPTNKATKVLRESVTRDDYKPECRTIYSLLKLRLEANGEVKELKAPEDPIDISAYKAVIVDEASMVNANLFEHIRHAATVFKIKFIFLGDAAQLPPVKELRSPVWELAFGARLTTVMRHDNAILALATALRDQVDKFAPKIRLVASNDGEQGIWKYPGLEFERQIILDVDAGAFVKPNGSKVIAWRNVEVDKFNALIRNRI